MISTFTRAIGALVLLSTSAWISTVDAKPYKAAEVYTKQTYKYGRYEMRMKVAKVSGILSTFFTYKNGSEISGNTWEEIDLEVFGKNNATQWQSNVIIGVTPNVTRTEGVHTAAASLADDYHTYALEWTPEYIAWYVDGDQVRRITGGSFVTSLVSNQDMRFNIWPCNVSAWAGTFSDSVLPLYQFVNYIDYRPYDPATKNFVGTGFRDEFNSFDTSRWGMSSHTFGDNIADFEPLNVTTKDSTLVLSVTKEGQSTYTGNPPVDTGIHLEAENFNEKGGTVNVAGGVVGGIDAGEWMKYKNVWVPITGTYKIEYKVASAITTAQFTLDRNGVGLGTLSVPNTGSWGTYTIISHNIYLTAGMQDLAIYANSGGFNIDYIRLKKI